MANTGDPNATLGTTIVSVPTYTKELPPFRGDGSDHITPENFVRLVDEMVVQRGCTDEQAAICVKQTFRDTAARWAEGMQDSGMQKHRDIFLKWSSIKKEFLERFAKRDDATKRVHALRNLKQNQKEDVRTFADRVQHATMACFKRNLISPVGSDMRDREEEIVEDIQLHLFRAGLKFDTTNYVDMFAKGKDLNWKETLTLAREHEEIAARTPANSTTAKVATVTTTGDDNGGEVGKETEVAAIQSKTTGTKKKKPPSNKTAKKPMKERGWLICRRCKQWGQHIASECPYSVDDIKSFTEADPTKKPTGEPADPYYYPN